MYYREYLATGSKVALVIVSTVVMMAGCFTPSALKTQFNEGVRCIDSGDYGKSYDIFRQLNLEYPKNKDVAAYFATSRGLAFRQAIARSERFLSAGDLDEFLVSMRKAQEIQPSDRVKLVIQMVDNDLKSGKSYQDIVLQLRKNLTSDVAPGSVEAAVRDLAVQVKKLVADGTIMEPVGMSGITAEGKSNDACVLVENALSRELINSGIKVVSRKKDDIAGMAGEAGLSGRDGTDADSAVEVGKMMGASSLLTGTLVKTSDATSRLQIKCLDAATGQVKLESSPLMIRK